MWLLDAGLTGGLFVQCGRQDFVLAFQDILAFAYASSQFISANGLGQVIIRAAAESGFQDLSASFRGQHDDVMVSIRVVLTNLSNQFGAFHAWHHPVDDQQAWELTVFQKLAGFESIVTCFGVKAPTVEVFGEANSNGRAVVYNQEFHRFKSLEDSCWKDFG